MLTKTIKWLYYVMGMSMELMTNIYLMTALVNWIKIKNPIETII